MAIQSKQFESDRVMLQPPIRIPPASRRRHAAWIHEAGLTSFGEV